MSECCFRNRAENTAWLTRWWPLGLRCLPAPCAGWCCCALLQTGSCARPRECCTWLLGRGPPPAARHGSRSLPGKPVSWGPSEASGLSNWSHKEMGGGGAWRRIRTPTLINKIITHFQCYLGPGEVVPQTNWAFASGRRWLFCQRK